MHHVFYLQVSRVPAGGPPPVVAVKNVDLNFPPSLGAVLAALAPAVDMLVSATPAAGGAIVDAVSVTFTHRGNGSELHLDALPEPVSIVWPVQNGHAMLQPVGQYYQCVFDVCEGDGQGLGAGGKGCRVFDFAGGGGGSIVPPKTGGGGPGKGLD